MTRRAGKAYLDAYDNVAAGGHPIPRSWPLVFSAANAAQLLATLEAVLATA